MPERGEKMTSNKSMPFHESVLAIINFGYVNSVGAIHVLVSLVLITDIPKEHDRIIAALMKLRKVLPFNDMGATVRNNIIKAIEHIEAERRRHAKPSPSIPRGSL